MLAAVGCGTFSDITAAGDIVRNVEYSVEPDPLLMGRYDAEYGKFRRFYPALKNTGIAE